MNDKQGTPHLSVGDLVDGRYELLDEIGEGGFATVYRARQRVIERVVALKVLHIIPNPRKAQAFAERFAHEARVAAQLHHPNVVTVHDFGFAGVMQQPYIAMEMLVGEGLDETLRREGAFAPHRALVLCRQALDALRAGHRIGVVHKDLKPANLFLCRDLDDGEFIKILDFGVARLATEATSHTATGEVIGTPQYLAPEYILEQLVTPAFDVYQMGLILVELLTGRKVVAGMNPYNCAMKHAEGNLEVPDILWRSQLGGVLRGSLQRDHRLRFADAGEMLAELDRVDPRSLEAELRHGIVASGPSDDDVHSATGPLGPEEPWVDRMADRAGLAVDEAQATEVYAAIDDLEQIEDDEHDPTAVHNSAQVARILNGQRRQSRPPAGGPPPWADPKLFAAHAEGLKRELQSAAASSRGASVAQAVALGAANFAAQARQQSAHGPLDPEGIERSFQGAHRAVAGGRHPVGDDDVPTGELASVPADAEVHGHVVARVHHAETRVAGSEDLSGRGGRLGAEIDLAQVASARASEVVADDEIDKPTLLHLGDDPGLDAVRQAYRSKKPARRPTTHVEVPPSGGMSQTTIVMVVVVSALALALILGLILLTV